MKRSEKASSLQAWGFRGGGVDKGENSFDSAVRECFEETGLTINNVKPLATIWLMEEYDEAVIISYTASVNTDQVTLSWEHEEYKWVDKDFPELLE